jgi:aerotaxis receptor
MKKNLPVTDREIPFPKGKEVVSATDLKGIITECNDAFVELSGFTKEELIGSSHNIVRHPDVPPAVFQNLGDTLKAGKPWMGIVKNRSKNGDYYWVDAYVTPMLSNGEVVGYESVRTEPSRERVALAEQLYKDIGSNKRFYSIFDMNSSARLWIGAFAIITALMSGWLYSSPDSYVLAGIAYVLSLLASFVAIRWGTRDIREAVKEASDFIDNPVLQQLYTGQVNDISAMKLVRYMQDAHLRTVLGRVQFLSNQVMHHSEIADQIAQHASEGVNKQRSETDMLATAMEEMSTSIADVAESASQASQSADLAAEKAETGRMTLDRAAESVQSLDNIMGSISDVVNDLHRDADSIGSVTDVIQNIAEQTNLLALNAAIEAARAGEQGRGFAVVADEVRSLATRTGESTQEIRELIEMLQQRVDEVVKVMAEGKDKAQHSARDTNNIHDELNLVLDSVEDIRNKNMVIATAAREQSVVANEMSQNVHNISNLSLMTTESVEKAASESAELNDLAEGLTNMVQRFRQ